MSVRKIADGYIQFDETRYPAEGVRMDLTVSRIDGEDLDTGVRLEGEFAISGSRRDEFSQKLEALIDEYRI